MESEIAMLADETPAPDEVQDYIAELVDGFADLATLICTAYSAETAIRIRDLLNGEDAAILERLTKLEGVKDGRAAVRHTHETG